VTNAEIDSFSSEQRVGGNAYKVRDDSKSFVNPNHTTTVVRRKQNSGSAGGSPNNSSSSPLSLPIQAINYNDRHQKNATNSDDAKYSQFKRTVDKDRRQNSVKRCRDGTILDASINNNNNSNESLHASNINCSGGGGVASETFLATADTIGLDRPVANAAPAKPPLLDEEADCDDDENNSDDDDDDSKLVLSASTVSPPAAGDKNTVDYTYTETEFDYANDNNHASRDVIADDEDGDVRRADDGDNRGLTDEEAYSLEEAAGDLDDEGAGISDVEDEDGGGGERGDDENKHTDFDYREDFNRSDSSLYVGQMYLRLFQNLIFFYSRVNKSVYLNLVLS